MKTELVNLSKTINETTYIPTNTENDIFELFQLDTIADLRKVSRNFMKLHLMLNYLDSLTDKASSEKAGIVKFGLNEGNAVDVKDWTKAIGGLLGGYVSEVENKEAGKWYINDLTNGKIYKCITAHTSKSFDITKYEDVSNFGILDKLNNLFKTYVVGNPYNGNLGKSVVIPELNAKKILTVTVTICEAIASSRTTKTFQRLNFIEDMGMTIRNVRYRMMCTDNKTINLLEPSTWIISCVEILYV